MYSAKGTNAKHMRTIQLRKLDKTTGYKPGYKNPINPSSIDVRLTKSENDYRCAQNSY